jgi:tRNA(fMet)-specific endonuclease VapC
MNLLDTDTFSLLCNGHLKVEARLKRATDTVALTIITEVEALLGRYAYLMRAANGPDVLRAQSWLHATEEDLERLPIVPFNEAAGAEFDRLLATKGLKKIDRGDLLIAAIALAKRATVVTRNLKDFRKVPGLQIENWAD